VIFSNLLKRSGRGGVYGGTFGNGKLYRREGVQVCLLIIEQKIHPQILKTDEGLAKIKEFVNRMCTRLSLAGT
jgi:hypothetical protein